MEKHTEFVNYYELNVRGVWGRNRTEKFQSIRIQRAPRDGNQPSSTELLVLAEQQLEGMKLKTGRWTVVRRAVEVEHYEPGVKIERWALFTDQTTILNGSR
jgi:hypothetical protein